MLPRLRKTRLSRDAGTSKLTNKEENGVLDAEIKWNFNKFLLDENGHIIAKFDSGTTPMSEEITGKL